MPNFCNCGLEITGPDRAAILDAVKAEPYTDDDGVWTVYFDIEKIVPRPEGLWEKGGEEWSDWVRKNWGSIVYPDRQGHRESEPNDPGHDFDYLWWTSPWRPPSLALCALSRMFPANSFLLIYGTDPFIDHMTSFQAGRAEEKSDKQVQQILETDPAWARQTVREMVGFCNAAASGEFDQETLDEEQAEAERAWQRLEESPEMSATEVSQAYEEAERALRRLRER